MCDLYTTLQLAGKAQAALTISIAIKVSLWGDHRLANRLSAFGRAIKNGLVAALPSALVNGGLTPAYILHVLIGWFRDRSRRDSRRSRSRSRRSRERDRDRKRSSSPRKRYAPSNPL